MSKPNNNSNNNLMNRLKRKIKECAIVTVILNMKIKKINNDIFINIIIIYNIIR